MLKDDEATTGFDLFMARQNEDDLKELTRLLYVAATRAADYLILSAGADDLDKATGPWLEMLARRFDLATGAFQSIGGDFGRRSASAPEGKGDRHHLCAAPSGPFRQMVPVPFFPRPPSNHWFA